MKKKKEEVFIERGKSGLENKLWLVEDAVIRKRVKKWMESKKMCQRKEYEKMGSQ